MRTFLTCSFADSIQEFAEHFAPFLLQYNDRLYSMDGCKLCFNYCNSQCEMGLSYNGALYGEDLHELKSSNQVLYQTLELCRQYRLGQSDKKQLNLAELLNSPPYLLEE